MLIVTSSSNRDMILRILTEKTGAAPVYSYAPDFAYTVGGYVFRRDGVIECESDYAGITDVLSAAGLCGKLPSTASAESTDSHTAHGSSDNDDPCLFTCPVSCFYGKLPSAASAESTCSHIAQGSSDNEDPGLFNYPVSCLCSRRPSAAYAESTDSRMAQGSSGNDDPGLFTYPVSCHSGKTLLNLVGMLSARQKLINQAIGAKGFLLDSGLVRSLYDHPPVTLHDFLLAVLWKEELLKGLILNERHIVLDGFDRGKATDVRIKKQLADALIASALRLSRVKPFTRDVRNRKYAMRTWMNEIGMTGPEYEEARSVLLGRLYGRSDQRKL